MPLTGDSHETSRRVHDQPVNWRVAAACALGLAIAVSLLVLAVIIADPPGQKGPGPKQPLTPCSLPGLGVAARCGTIEVREVPGNSTGRGLPIRVVVVPAAVTTPLPDPMLFLAGGPGQGAASLAGRLWHRLSSLRSMRDLIFVDQRGTGGSNPLTCPVPDATTVLMGRMFDVSRLATCRDQLAQRADLHHYTTAAAAADYEAVLDALNYRQVNVWGVSYGSRLGLELARRMPGRVRTLILEGAVPNSLAWPTYGARDADGALEALVADCEADGACAASYPTLRRDVDAAFARLGKQPVLTPVFDPHSRTTTSVPFGHSDLAYATRGLLYGEEALTLPRLFRAAASGRFDGFAQAYVTRARTLGEQVATGVHLGVYCAEDVPYADMARARQLAAGTRLGTYLLDEYAAACKVWPRGLVPQAFHDPVRSDVPTLILAGRRDPVTPPWTAEAVANTLTRVRVLTWHAGGHGFDGLATPSCKLSMISDFVTRARPDEGPTTCMAHERRLPFVSE